jgi:hypothetical protein
MEKTIVEYGRLEKRYARPIAEALAQNQEFRVWLLERTVFFGVAASARLLDKEMLAMRSKTATSWWASHFTEACRCEGCRGQETDIFAVFEAPGTGRFALHIEVKHPGDKFKKGGTQAASYPIRASCWATEGSTPTKVLPHSAASTVLLYSFAKSTEYGPHLEHFASLITFEEIFARFPALAV